MIRDARADDLDDVLRLYRQLQPDDRPILGGADRRTFARILASPLLRVLLLEVEGTVVGTTYLNVIPNLTRAASPYAVIENVVVDEGRRGTGLGKRLMAATLDAAWDAGCYKAMLLTGSKQASTHAFYRSCGFSPEEKAAYVARPPS